MMAKLIKPAIMEICCINFTPLISRNKIKAFHCEIELFKLCYILFKCLTLNGIKYRNTLDIRLIKFADSVGIVKKIYGRKIDAYKNAIE
jgi:hypothetical protein